MQHWFGPDARVWSPWSAARVLLAVARRVLALVAAGARPAAGDLLARIPDSRPTSTQVRALALGVATTLGLATPAAFTVRAPNDEHRVRDVASSDGMSRIRIQLPRVDEPELAAPVHAPEPRSVTTGEPRAAVRGQRAVREPSAPEFRRLPTGKGMWLHTLEQTAATPDQLVAHARSVGLTHVFVRLGSSRMGFYGAADLDRLLPVAHAAGLSVVGWDFPYLDDPVDDARRALAEIAYTTPDGHRIDAFSADIETPSEGVRLAADRVDAYGTALRRGVGSQFPLVGTVPNACTNQSFPFDVVARHFDALAPMVYWINRDPVADVACNVARLAPMGRPVMPVGQAYDPAIDNPRLVGLVPGYEDLARFMAEAARLGSPGVSFWAWHTATPEMWQALADTSAFSLTEMSARHEDGDAVAVLQRVLGGYGFPLVVDGEYGAATVGALAALQTRFGLEPTGDLDALTLRALGHA